MEPNKLFGNLPPLSLAGVPLTERRTKWTTWKRGFEIWLRTAKIVDGTEKKNLLLTCGSLELQEIFFSIPDADVEADVDQGVDPYEIAILKLDEYFAPQRHEAHERFLFWSMKPEPEETLEKFVMRAQAHGSKCNFGATAAESAGIAIIDKVLQFVPANLRVKLLQEKNLSLDEVIKQINSYETSRVANEQMSGRSKSFEIDNQHIHHIKTLCRFCGRTHGQQSCPARDKTCAKCGKRGHFAVVCYSNAGQTSNRLHTNQRMQKRPFGGHFNDSELNKKTAKFARKIHAIQDDGNEPLECELVEMVSSANDSDELIWAKVGGILIEMQIDSGVQSNIIDDRTWASMRNNQVKIIGEARSPDRKFKAYAQTDCLEIITMFEAEIAIADGLKELRTISKFYVVKNGPQPLLGKITAKQLGVLYVGLPSQHESINQVETFRAFPSIRGVSIHIPIDKTVTPVAQRLRRLPLPMLDKVDSKLNELVAKDIIEKVSEPSSWVSPMVIVVKDCGSIRLCIDMRQVNKAILRETHPLPTIEDIRWRMNGAKYFSRLDIKDAFHQLLLDEESKTLTTFITHRGLYRYKRMMFGISCAPEKFQKILEQVLADCPNTVNFIDDIIVTGKTETEHDLALEKVMEKIEEYGILLNQSKCVFKLTEIEFVGQRFNQNGMLPALNKIEAIRSFRPPKNCEEVRSFLGLITYVGTFIPNLATVSFPLRELTKNNAEFVWERDQNKAFNELIRLVSNVERLAHFDPHLKTRVVADASPVGLGAVLLQFQNEQPKVIAYASKSLTSTEQRYAQTEKEALALVWAVERFQIYLFGIRFELETDHKPLEAIFSPTSSPCLRIERWVLRLQAFSYDVIYRKGKTNIADPLSRLSSPTEVSEFDPDSTVYIRSVMENAAIDVQEVEIASSNDAEMRALKECLERGVWNYTDELLKPYQAFRLELGTVGDLVVRGSKLVIPKAIRQRMLELAHEGHPGRTKMQQRLRCTCWWPGMDEAIARLVSSCSGCQLVSQPDKPEPMKRRPLPHKPWVDVAIDFLGPLPTGDYLLVIIDYFSRYKEVEIVKKITAIETSERLERIFVRLGYPRTITLDNGRQFVSNYFDNYCKQRGILLNKTTPYWPQENGLVERQNRSLLKRLKISQAQNGDWKKDLGAYLSMYYATPHSTTGKTPSELMFNRNIRTKIPSLGDISTGSALPMSDYRDRDTCMKEKGRVTEDQRRKAKPSDIIVGDRVLLRNTMPGNKLSTPFGPQIAKVIEKQGSRVTVQDEQNGKLYDRNSSHLKEYKDPDDHRDGCERVVDNQEEGVGFNEPTTEEIPRTLSRPKREIKRPARFLS
ncbi:uncharacterized protein K02A2.6-like [Anopheles gambiae]|uniref:uncharacterized protein K02A2.6-like n=1 Tax=Anopheles gambiae TaxID=7165 RepID=UPI002AC917E7|nr:uncharacterized protein K02A2.6-like [Anopheles gambiae]